MIMVLGPHKKKSEARAERADPRRRREQAPAAAAVDGGSSVGEANAG
jgi:hypothetical protein